MLFSVLVAAAFVVMIATFFAYDLFVERRNRKLVLTAARSSEVVTSMFPGPLRDKILDQTRANQQSGGGNGGKNKDNMRQISSQQMKALASGDDLNDLEVSVPVAELYPHTTVCFMDIVGFTAWSSGKSFSTCC